VQNHALIATRKGLFEIRRGSNGWQLDQQSFPGDPVSMVLHDPRDGSLYAALNLGHFGVKLHRRERGANRWTEIAVPVYPLQPADSQDEIKWKLQLIWSLATGGEDKPGVLWAGTLPGGLFRSDDKGQSWQLIQSLWDAPKRREWFGGGFNAPGIHSISVDPRNSSHVLVGISCGGAWLTRDDGASWSLSARGMTANYMPPERTGDQEIQDPHRIARCTGAPEVFWCQHHNGIWRSTDNGAFWNQIRSADLRSDFGFAVAAHPQDSLTAWFVPAVADANRVPIDAALAVTRTRDGGKTFQRLSQGLPQKDCYDLVYRHGLAVADDGQTLLMGSTTGGLWISEDGGDTWQTIAHHLPPIYAVHFS
jgi:hypothetical protein